MTKVSKELLRNYVKEQDFKSSNDVLTAMKEMFADVLQEALEAEMDTYLGYDRYEVSEKSTDNGRNGHSKKTVKSELGNVELRVPRDRKGGFEPQIIPKHKRSITGLDEKILSLYAKGMTTTDIKEQIKELYDVEISTETVSNVTGRIMPLVTEWQNRPLEDTHSFVFMDAIHYKAREDKQIIVKAAHVVLVVNMDGEDVATNGLIALKEKWGSKYPNAISSWEDNWDDLMTFFAFPDFIRKIMYTTNAIESLNSQFRKVTKNKKHSQLMTVC